MSSVIDEDTARTIDAGRETIGALLRAAQKELQKVFIVFVLGLLGSIWALRTFLWKALKENTKQRMPPEIAAQVDIIARTPFDVILLQFKIGAVVGILLALPLLLYYAKEPLKRRGWTPEVPVSRAQLVGLSVLMTLLFVGGVAYAYIVFFPFMFEFLAQNAINATLKPTWDITMWTQFLFLLTLSFGLAAQLPLVMSSLSYAELVPYETWRDKWKYAVVLIFTFGAVASPPDPLTQVMWGLPLCTLYAASLALSKVVINLRRRGEGAAEADGLLRMRMLQFGAFFAVLLLGSVLAIRAGAVAAIDATVVPALPAALQPANPVASGALDPAAGWVPQALISLQIAIVLSLLVLLAYTLRVLQSPVVPRDVGRTMDPADIDLDALDEAGVRAAPPEVFAEMTEDEALAKARTAMDAENPDKAQAILDRFDAIQEQQAAADAAEGAAAGAGAGAGADAAGGAAAGESSGSSDGHELAAGPPGDGPVTDVEAMEDAAGAGATADADEESSTLQSTAAGMVDPFTDEETTEDDIGGYYYDISFVLQSLTSKVFRLVVVFMATLAGVFFWLYRGGLGDIKRQFLSQVPPEVRGDPNSLPFTESVETANAFASALTTMPGGTATAANGPSSPTTVLEAFPTAELLANMGGVGQIGIVVALHPVEQLIFAVKASTIVAAGVTLPLLGYYAWPAVKERGFGGGGDSSAFLYWGAAMFLGFAAGSALGYLVFAPGIVSYLVEDAIRASMVISYRVNSFMWLIAFMTVGIGFLLDIPVSMLLFHYTDIVSYDAMVRASRGVVLALFVAGAFITNSGVLSMLLFALPLAIAYGVGLAILRVLTTPGRLFGGGGGGSETETEVEGTA
jgi:sec-independent protein translocase protein TatC